MPDYLPLGALRQGLLPGECRSCSWWQTTGPCPARQGADPGELHEWMAGLEQDWGSFGLLAYDSGSHRGAVGSAELPVVAAIRFAPASSLARFRELPFPPLPPFSALLFCLHTEDDAPRWVAKRLIRKALCELRSRGIDQVFAVAHRAGSGNGHGPECRFFSASLLAENGFNEVASNGYICLMRVESRNLVSLIDQVEMAVRRVFIRGEEPACSPAAWAERREEAEQGVP
jgi:hypothetical protein